MTRSLLYLCPLKDVRRLGDWNNQEERQSRGQAGTDLHTPRGHKTQIIKKFPNFFGVVYKSDLVNLTYIYIIYWTELSINKISTEPSTSTDLCYVISNRVYQSCLHSLTPHSVQPYHYCSEGGASNLWWSELKNCVYHYLQLKTCPELSLDPWNPS